MRKLFGLLILVIVVFITYMSLFTITNIEVTEAFQVDPYGKNYDFSFVLKVTGSDKETFTGNLTGPLNEDISDFAKGDILLILGRIEGNDTKICESFGYYENSLSGDQEKNAVIYETLASLGCGRDVKSYLLNASRIWKSMGNEFRSNLDASLALEDEIDFEMDTSELLEFDLEVPENATKFVIGNSIIKLGEDDILVSQADRVVRDWLSYQIYDVRSEDLLTTFSERLTYDKDELLPEIGWHEGARISEMRNTGLKHLTAYGTIAKKSEGKWYVPDERGVFRFEVPIDKILYPTTRFLRDDMAVIIDTHGINTLVEQAIRLNASVVIGCCDHPGKIKAALYLNEMGIKSICLTDKYLPLAMGSGANILGSPPIRKEGDLIILGGRPLEFGMNETFVVMDVSGEKFGLNYYETPKIYFRQLERFLNVDVHYALIYDFGQMENVINLSEAYEANTIAVRVFNSDDYRKVRGWLEEDENRKAILFHSVSYPYGYKLLKEFPGQTTFDDIRPEFS